MADLVVGGGETVMATPQFGFDGQTVADGQPDGGWRKNGDGSPMVTPLCSVSTVKRLSMQRKNGDGET
jgi:hypothetical protein